MSPFNHFNVGDIFHERYKIEKHIGSGGFADVWLAEDLRTNEKSALKIFSRLDVDGQELLVKEYSNLRKLNHPNILKAEHFDIFQETPYLVMPYCAGGNLEKQIGAINEDQIKKIIHDVCAGLAYLHRQGIIHQDIKPANILLDENGDYLLSDFGISSRTKSTLSKSVIGERQTQLLDEKVGSGGGMTMDYAPPEKFHKNLDEQQPHPAGDVFSFGLTVFELLTGTLPFQYPVFTGLAMMSGSEVPELPGSFSAGLKEALKRCLALEKSDRLRADAVYNFINNPVKVKTKRSPKPKKVKEKKPRNPEAGKKLKKVFVTILLIAVLGVAGYLSANSVKQGRTERLAFEAAKDTNTVSAFEAYLDTFPEGKHVTTAKYIISNIQEEDSVYNLAIKQNTIEAFNGYIDKYSKAPRVPRYQNEADSLIKELHLIAEQELKQKREADSIAAAQVAARQNRLNTREGRIEVWKEKIERLSRNSSLYDLTIKNNCRERIHVAIHYKDLANNWVTEGWWGVAPGETSSPTIKTKHRYIYFYATSTNNIWSGKNATHNIEKLVSSQKFTRISTSDRLPGFNNIEAVIFFREDMGTGDWDYTVPFKCN